MMNFLSARIAGTHAKVYVFGKLILSLKVRHPKDPPKIIHECWGEDFPFQKFLVIRRKGKSSGLFSHYVSNIGWIRFAMEHGMIPVVDMHDMCNCAAKDGENPYERFFEQPTSYDLNAVRHAKHVSIAVEVPDEFPSVWTPVSDQLPEWRRIAKEYARVAPDILQEVDCEMRTLFGDEQNVLGVFLRGTDYVALRPHGHPIQPAAKDVIADVENLLAQRKYRFIYLVTEDRSIESLFRDVFGESLKTAKQPIIEYAGRGRLSENSNVADNAELARRYLVRIIILSKCRGIIASLASGTAGSELMSDGHEYTHFYDIGCYD